MVTASTGVQTDLSKVVHPSCRSICHLSEPQTSTVCVSSRRPKCLGHRWSKHKVVSSHCLCLPSDGSPSQGDPKNQAMQLTDHCNSPRLARDTLVLGPSAAFNRDPISATSVKNSSQTVPQLCVSQQSTTSQPPRLLSRSGQLQGQGSSVKVAEIIAAPQRSSTRTIYKSKWALFEKWCSQSPTHSRPAECGSRQAIQARPDHSNRVVSPSRSFPSYMKQVAPASSRPVCHEVQQQVTSVCVTGSGSPSYSSGCT